MSTFLLRRESGVAQGFTFFDAERGEEHGNGVPVVARDSVQTINASGSPA